MSREEIDSDRSGITGGSQGGGLTIVTAALRPEVRVAVAAAPFPCGFMKSIELAKTYIFVQYYLTRVPANIMESSKTKYIDEKIFWTEMIKILDQYKHEEDLLLNMMKNQVKNNDMHTMDYRIIKKINLEKALTKLSEEQNPFFVGYF